MTDVAADVIDQVPAKVVSQHWILPVLVRGGKLVVAMDDPAVAYQLDDLGFVLNTEIQRGLTYAAAATVIARAAEGQRYTFVASELRGLQIRSVHRVLKILALSYATSRLSAISVALLSDDPAHRSNALGCRPARGILRPTRAR